MADPIKDNEDFWKRVAEQRGEELERLKALARTTADLLANIRGEIQSSDNPRSMGWLGAYAPRACDKAEAALREAARSRP